jgi:hypothetical protein
MSEQEQLLLKRIDSKLTALLNQPKKQTWVGVAVIKELTGWEGREKLRWARDNNLVVFDKTKGYLLESIPELFIIKSK